MLCPWVTESWGSKQVQAPSVASTIKVRHERVLGPFRPIDRLEKGCPPRPTP